MATLSIRLDSRSLKKDGTAPLVAIVRNGSTMASLPLGIYLEPDQWDGNTVVKHPRKRLLNSEIQIKRGELESLLHSIVGIKTRMSAKEIRGRILASLNGATRSESPTLLEAFDIFITKKEKQNTKDSFLYTKTTIERYDRMASSIQFDDITKHWLEDFEQHLLHIGMRVNTVAIHLENLRAVINYAIDEEWTDKYPFKRFRIKREASKHRALSPETIRQVFAYNEKPLASRTNSELYLDMFRLSFLLCGMNLIDLYALKDTDVRDGRITICRTKTGVPISIKAEPEMLAIVTRWKGKNGNLLCLADRYSNQRSLLSAMNKGLKTIGPETRVGHVIKRKPLWPFLSTYWARHSWATLASQDMEVPIEVIAQGLAHVFEGMTIRYISQATKRLDEANRKIIDFVTGV